jgi:hemolysin activation/secretion protein
MKLTSKKTLLFSTLAVSSYSVMANVIPDSGQLLQQQNIQPTLPKAELKIETTQQMSNQLSDSEQQFHVKHIEIQGNESIHSDELNKIVQGSIDQDVSLADLQKLTLDLTRYYQTQGYPYHRAYLPVQNLADGQVVIGILEARYDQIDYVNHTDLSDALIENILAPLNSGDIISGEVLQQQLMILNRLNGVKVRNVLSAGRYPGTSTLTVEVQPDQKLTGYIGLDNYGNEYTRELRLNAGLNVNNAFGLGDQLSLNAMTSGHLNFARLGYEATVSGSGTRVGASYSELDYKLGKEYKALDAVGHAQQANVWVKQPIYLSNQTEVVLGTQYDFKRMEDDIEVADLYRHRDLHIGQINLNVTQKDDFAGGGLTEFGVSSDFGYVKFNDAAAAKLDKATADTQGQFITAALNVSRLQNLGASSTQLFTQVQAQYSPDNLDSAQQFTVGGVSGVAGYENSVLSGSTGYYALAELKRELYGTGYQQLSAKLFVDTAHVKRQAHKWRGLTGDNEDQIHSAGFGLNWANRSKWSAALRVGFPIGPKPDSLNERNDVESWFSINKQF